MTAIAFRPPAPQPRTKPLGLLAGIAALRGNPIENLDKGALRSTGPGRQDCVRRTGAIATKHLERVVVEITVQEKAIARRIPSARISRPQLPGPL